jgi:hypothetical protein
MLILAVMMGETRAKNNISRLIHAVKTKTTNHVKREILKNLEIAPIKITRKWDTE